MKRLKKEVADIQDAAKKQFLPPGCPVNLDGASKTWPQDSTTKSPESPDDQARDLTKGIVPKTTIQVIRNDLYSTLPLHCRMTLSQFYYHSRLQKPKQVVTRHFEDKWPNEDPLTLMVDQLWMLVLIDGTYLSCLEFGVPR